MPCLGRRRIYAKRKNQAHTRLQIQSQGPKSRTKRHQDPPVRVRRGVEIGVAASIGLANPGRHRTHR
ncbi:hypothetical protein VTK26DRAFT_9266 [Humicola hyalothermophila]